MHWQNIVSRSSTKAEFRSMAATMAVIAWLIGLFKEIGLKYIYMCSCSVTSKLQYKLQLIQYSMKEQNILILTVILLEKKLQDGQI